MADVPKSGEQKKSGDGLNTADSGRMRESGERNPCCRTTVADDEESLDAQLKTIDEQNVNKNENDARYVDNNHIDKLINETEGPNGPKSIQIDPNRPPKTAYVSFRMRSVMRAKFETAPIH